MIRTTPFHERLTELNDQHLFTHWSGYLSALRFSHAPKHEYFAVRNAVGVFDTSPLFKYRITGPDAVDFLSARVPDGLRLTLRAPERRWTVGEGEEVTLTGSRTDLIAWLAGRAPDGRITGEAPELKPWP